MLYIKIFSYLFTIFLFPLISVPGGWITFFFFMPFVYLPGIFLTAYVLMIFEKIASDTSAQKMLLKMITLYILGCLLFVDGGDGDIHIGIDAFVNRVIFHNFASFNMTRVIPEIFNILGIASFGLLIYFVSLNVSFIQKFKVKKNQISEIHYN